MFNISVIGAGNGGQAMAGHLSLMGHDVTLYTRSNEKKTTILQAGGIILKEAINGFGKLTRVTNSIEEAVSVSEILMITVTANAHGEIAERIFPFLKEGQIIVLNPGRTGGALEIRNIFNKKSLRIKV